MSINPPKRKRVAVFPGSRCDSDRRLFASLADLYPADFITGESTGPQPIDGALFFPEVWDLSERAFERGISSFRFAPQGGGIRLAATGNVAFARHAVLPQPFQDAQIPLGSAIAVVPLPAKDGEEALARQDSVRLWQFRPGGNAELYTSAAGPPELSDDQLLCSHLRPENWLDLFPLLHFIRYLTAGADWSPAPRRACFMFDDPNLHASQYGYLHFDELACQAAAHQYHVALATVPLDAVYAARKAVGLFRAAGDRLSLLIHGNDHVKHELGRAYTPVDGMAMLSQALGRVARLEHRTGLRIARVVAPPHGVCSELIMSLMMALGFEAICGCLPDLVRSDKDAHLPLSFGLSPVSCIAGLPVIRRFHLRYDAVQLRFAAFLDQPIIPYGHHHDCASGLDRLARIAGEVNSWGRTSWTNMENIIRTCYRTRREGELLHIMLDSRRVDIAVPPGVTHLAIHVQALGEGDDCEAVAAVAGGGVITCVPGVPVQVPPLAVLRLVVPPRQIIDAAAVRAPSWRAWPPLRRALAIARDRLAPVVKLQQG